MASPARRGGTTCNVSELTTTSVHTGSGVFAPLHLRYTYDAMGNILTENRLNPDGSTAESLTYTYDNQFQLTGAVSSVNGAWNYRYDTYGNLRGKDHGSDSVSYTYGDANWLDLLTAVSGTKNGTSFSGSYTYDGAGNPTSFFNVGDLSTWTMTWRNGRELATASNGTHSVSYDYDVNGLRTYKIVDGVRHDYTYASGQLLRESFTQGGTAYTLDFLYDPDGRPYLLYLTTTNGSTTVSAPYYYILNLQGDVIHLVNTSGAAVASYTYDPYGSPLTAAGSLAAVNPLRYRGYYYDTETGFYYLQSRYYDPALGRFLNADSYASTGQGFLGYNMFAYCKSSPTTTVDFSGHYCVCVAVYDGGGGAHSWTEIGQGWEYRIDQANERNKTQRHIHIRNKKKEEYSQNNNGKPHDKKRSKKGPIPGWINDYLKEKEGWDYNGNREKYFNQTTVSCYESGYCYKFADGTLACEEQPRFGYLLLPGHIRDSVDEYEDLYYPSISNAYSFGNDSSTIPIVVVPSGPICVPELPLIPVFA